MKRIIQVIVMTIIIVALLRIQRYNMNKDYDAADQIQKQRIQDGLKQIDYKQKQIDELTASSQKQVDDKQKQIDELTASSQKQVDDKQTQIEDLKQLMQKRLNDKEELIKTKEGTIAIYKEQLANGQCVPKYKQK